MAINKRRRNLSRRRPARRVTRNHPTRTRRRGEYNLNSPRGRSEFRKVPYGEIGPGPGHGDNGAGGGGGGGGGGGYCSCSYGGWEWAGGYCFNAGGFECCAYTGPDCSAITNASQCSNTTWTCQ